MEGDPHDEHVTQAEMSFSPRKTAKRKAVDPSAYSILKEGEADILLQHGNDVFYNKAQIVNRDLSIAVLRAYVTKIQEEDFEKLKKKRKSTVGEGSADVYAQAEQVTGIREDDQAQGELVISGSAYNENHLVASTADCDPLSTDVSQDGSNNANYSDSTTGTSKLLHILEALSASGLRALRYAREVDGVGSVTALDNDKLAVEACKRNIRLNGSVAISKVQAVLADARAYMLTHEKQFDVVDIDPYGSPSVFLDSAVQSVADGGLLMCTATDMAVLCGNNGEVCYSKYGSYPLRGKYCHEMALRILLSCIESHANRYKRHVVPLLSISVDFYIRVFVRIFTSANAVKASPSKLSYMYQCVGCDAFHLQPVGRIVHKNNSVHYMPGIGPPILPECRHCGRHFNMGGPIWSHPIHDPEWVSSILEGIVALKKRYPAYEKIHSVLTAVSEELLDVPLYLSLHALSATLKCTPPSASLFRYAIANAGYRISGTHAMALGLKTNAPMDVVWDIMRCWVKTHPVKSQPRETSGSVILSKEPTLEANFSKVQSALSKAQTKGVPRFLPNPEEFWGPKPRAGRQITFKHASLFGVTAINGFPSQNDSNEESLEEIEAKQQKQEMA